VRDGFGDADAVGDLLAALDDPDPDVRGAAVQALGRLRPSPVPPRLLEALDDPSSDVRHLALDAVAALGAKEAAARAAELVHDPEEDVRAAAGRALYALDPAKGRQALAELIDDPSFEVKQAAIAAAAESRDPDLQRRLLALLEHPGTRRFAAYHAGVQRIPGAGALLCRLLDSPDVNEAAEALSALGRLADPASVPALKRALPRMGSLWSRRAAAYALVQSGDPAGVPYLLRGRASFLTLNAVRRPDAWRRLHDLPVTLEFGGDLHADLRLLAKAAGLELEVSPGAAAVRLHREVPRPTPSTWTDDLTWVCSWDVVPILEEGRLRILSREEARAFWLPWWEAESKKLGER
jgi:hypothetical protein